MSSKQKTEELLRRILIENIRELDQSVCDDVYVAGNAAKLLLRALPETILTAQLFHDFCKVVSRFLWFRGRAGGAFFVGLR